MGRWGVVKCGDEQLVGSSPVPACQHALMWMFLFYCVFVCLFLFASSAVLFTRMDFMVQIFM